MKTVYADTGYWIALLNARDEGHDQAVSVSGLLGATKVLTSEIVIVEVLNYFAGYGRGFREAAVKLVLGMYSDPQVTVVPLTSDLMASGIALYADRPDKKWGLADCISFKIMDHFEVHEALAFDEHFVQAGYSTLL